MYFYTGSNVPLVLVVALVLGICITSISDVTKILQDYFYIMKLTTIVILEDDAVLRATLLDYLTISGEYMISYSGSSVSEFMDITFEETIDFILLDIHLANSYALDFINSIKFKHKEAKIIIITGDTEDDLVLKSIVGGANGFIYKPFSLSEVSATINNIKSTGSYLPPQVVNKLVNSINKSKSLFTIKEEYDLTDREIDILYLTKHGLSYKEIAYKLEISYHTVNYHMKNLYEKLKVSSKAQLLSKYL